MLLVLQYVIAIFSWVSEDYDQGSDKSEPLTREVRTVTMDIFVAVGGVVSAMRPVFHIPAVTKSEYLSSRF